MGVNPTILKSGFYVLRGDPEIDGGLALITIFDDGINKVALVNTNIGSVDGRASAVRDGELVQLDADASDIINGAFMDISSLYGESYVIIQSNTFIPANEVPSIYAYIDFSASGSIENTVSVVDNPRTLQAGFVTMHLQVSDMSWFNNMLAFVSVSYSDGELPVLNIFMNLGDSTGQSLHVVNGECLPIDPEHREEATAIYDDVIRQFYQDIYHVEINNNYIQVNSDIHVYATINA